VGLAIEDGALKLNWSAERHPENPSKERKLWSFSEKLIPGKSEREEGGMSLEEFNQVQETIEFKAKP